MTIATDLPNESRVSEEEVERITRAFKMPEFAFPYPLKKNPHSDKAKAEAFAWMKEMSLNEIYKTEEELQSFIESDVPEFAMFIYPECDEKAAAWAAKYYLWVFVFDDQMDDPAYFNGPDTAFRLVILELNLIIMWSLPDDDVMYNKFVECLDGLEGRAEYLKCMHSKLDEARQKPGTVYQVASWKDAPPVCKSFQDIWTQLCEKMPAEFLRRWARSYQKYVLANLSEIKNRKDKSIPSVDEYIPNRRDSAAIQSCGVIVEFLEDVFIPDKVFDCDAMDRFLIAFTDALAFHNDLWSFQKEALLGDVNNLVVAVSHEHKCSYPDSAAKIYQWIWDAVTDMERAISDLEKEIPPEYQYAISRYANMARSFLTGSQWVHSRSRRYVQCSAN